MNTPTESYESKRRPVTDGHNEASGASSVRLVSRKITRRLRCSEIICLERGSLCHVSVDGSIGVVSDTCLRVDRTALIPAFTGLVGIFVGHDIDGELSHSETDFLIDLKHGGIYAKVMLAKFQVSGVDADGIGRDRSASLRDTIEEVFDHTECGSLRAFNRNGTECGDIEGVALSHLNDTIHFRTAGIIDGEGYLRQILVIVTRRK